MKVHLPIVGKATGSSAGLIYQSYWGNTYTRSFPFSFHYPDTKKQQDCQATFFDIQRNWYPIYNQLKTHIHKNQRRNMNVFNKLSNAIYHILNPYKEKLKNRLPSNFGLDSLNRVRPVTFETSIAFKEESFTLHFNMGRPYNDISIQIEEIHVIIFDETQQTMLYAEDKLHGGFYDMVFKNTLDWKESDTLHVYLALSSYNWLGNFNKIL